MKTVCVKIVGSLNDTSWSQVHLFKPEDEKLITHGDLFAAISFKAKASIEISSFGAEIIKRLQEIYYSHAAATVFKKLSQTIETLAAEFLDQVELEIVAAVIWRNYLYAAKTATGQVWLKRAQNAVKLFSGEGLEIVSGKLNSTDVVLIATGQLTAIVPDENLRPLLMRETVTSIGESLTGLIHKHDDNSRTAAIVIGPAAAPALKPFKRLKPVRLPPIFLNRPIDWRRRSTLMIIGVLLITLMVSLFLSGRKKQLEEREREIQALIDEVTYKLEEANGLLVLNPLRAKSLLQESYQSLKEYKNDNKKPQPAILDLEKKVADALEQSQREYSVEAAEWYDFDLIKDGFRGEKWDLSGSEVLVVDPAGQTAVLLNLETKAAKEVISQENLGQVQVIGLTDKRGFIVAADKVTVVDTGKKAVTALVDADGWQKIVVARGFGGNLYLLDAAANGQIWKYLGLEEGLSGKRSYLAGDHFDLSEAKDMAIDGSVWVLFADGSIVKYTQGRKENFSVVGLDEPFLGATKIFTSPELENLYIIDQPKMRVVAVAKTGEYVAQYLWPGIAGAKELVVSEALGKIFFLTGEKIFTLDLR
jgi:hypothetical protein